MGEAFRHKIAMVFCNIFLVVFGIPLGLLFFFLVLPLLFVTYWIENRRITTLFCYRKTPFNEEVQRRILSDAGHYAPPWWYNNHFGSLIQFGKIQHLELDRELYENEDGSVFSVDWYPCRPSTTTTSRTLKVSLYMPGLGLSSDANVSQYYSSTFASNGFHHCGIITPRGHPTSGIPLVNSKLWHGGITEDLKLVLQQLQETFVNTHIRVKVFICGYSASSNIVVKSLIELNESEQVRLIALRPLFLPYSYSSSSLLLLNPIFLGPRLLSVLFYRRNYWSNVLLCKF